MKSSQIKLLEKLESYKNNTSIIYKNQQYSYKNLIEKINELLNLNIPNNSVVALIGDYSFDLIATFLALSIKKCIIIPILPSFKIENIQNNKDFGVDFIIKNNQISKMQDSQKHNLINKLIKQNLSGLVIFSSGSTGAPKGIVHNLDLMLDCYLQKKENPINTAGIFLIDHIAGIDVTLNQLAIGGILSIPSSRTPKSICELIQNHKVEILPASPTFLKLLLLSNLVKNYDLESLKLIIYGSEVMPKILLQNLKNTFPNVRFKQSFGTSETNAIKTKSSKQYEDFIKIDTEYKIINNELWIKSKTQTLGYINGDKKSFQNGWFKTGDIVESIIENNIEYLKIIGRVKEIINIGGQKVLPEEIENVIFQIEGIKDCLVYGEINPITGQSISAKIVIDRNTLNLNNNLELKKYIRWHCKKYLENYKIPTKVILEDSIEMGNRLKKIRNIKN